MFGMRINLSEIAAWRDREIGRERCGEE